MAISQEDIAAYKKERLEMGRGAGPVYGEAPLIWFDQVFQLGINPAGQVDCGQPLRVGATQNGLDVALAASAANSGELVVGGGATATLTLYQADRVDGDFEEVGPTICVKAPDAGFRIDPGCMLFRFPLGNFTKAWLKAGLEFSGTFSGGLVDCVLAYAPR